MDLQPQAMTRAVKKSNLTPIADFGRKTPIGEKLLHFVVQLQAIHTRLHFSQRQLLPCAHRLPKPALLFTRAPAHNRPRHIAEVTCLRITRKDIEDDERICFQRAEPALMRIARLIAAGHDCIRR